MKIKDNNYINLVNNVLQSNNKIVNKPGVGYKYYLPIGVNLVYNKDNNQKFNISGETLYLYVDVVSYHYQNKLNLIDNPSDYYYYSDINYNNNQGYIVVNKQEDTYFVKMVYNYAKIETYCHDFDIDKIITYGMIILDSITYNDTLISTMLSDSDTFTSDISYELDKPDDATSKFSQYLQEYVVEEETPIVELPEE